MIPMSRPSVYRICALVAGLGLILTSFSTSAQEQSSRRGRKYKSPPPTARIEVTVLRDSTEKPLENASVIFHTMEGADSKGNMELKTNEDGKTVIDVLTIGDTVRLQVIAKGFQTYGEDYKIEKSAMSIEIRMKRPGEQYSIYKKHPETASTAPESTPDKPASAPPASDASKDAPPPASSEKPAPTPDSQPK